MFHLYMPPPNNKRKPPKSPRVTRSAKKQNNTPFKTQKSPKTRKRNSPISIPLPLRETPIASPNQITPTNQQAPAHNLNTAFGRDVSLYEIQENDTTYPRLFYRTTGTGNGRFESVFVGALVPFYGTREDGTLVKAIMKRNGRNTLFEWQKELLEHLKDDITIETTIFDAFTLFLDNYINTPGELFISFTGEASVFRSVPSSPSLISTFFWENPYHVPLLTSIQSYFHEKFQRISGEPGNANTLPETSFELNTESIGLGQPQRSHWNVSQHFKLQKASPLKPRKKSN